MKYGALPNSKPLACGYDTSRIILLTQDPNKYSQEMMNKGKKKPEFIFGEENDFAKRISNYLFGNKKYSPSIKDGEWKKFIPRFRPQYFCWIHSVNVFCKKELLS